MQNGITEETTIRIKRVLKEKLDLLGKKNDTYNDIIENLFNHYESSNKKKGERNNGSS